MNAISKIYHLYLRFFPPLMYHQIPTHQHRTLRHKDSLTSRHFHFWPLNTILLLASSDLFKMQIRSCHFLIKAIKWLPTNLQIKLLYVLPLPAQFHLLQLCLSSTGPQSGAALSGQRVHRLLFLRSSCALGSSQSEMLLSFQVSC